MTTLAEAEALLAKYVPLAKEVTGRNITLERMVPLMEALGNPQHKLKIIHIAGTSGKTSTAYFISQMLTTANQKTGLTVSPHVDSVLERVQINTRPMNEHDFASNLSELVGIITEAEIEPTYFELLIAFAYWYFAKQKVDYAVIETGMGGLQDGTNIADNQDKICVITDIGLDHMHVLGHTVTEIARQKAGIIHGHNKVLIYRQPDEIMDVFASHSESIGAELNIFEQDVLAANKTLPKELESLPDFQKRNWLLAYETYMEIAEEGNLPDLNKDELASTMQVQVPGRMDQKLVQRKNIIMDGAHNEQKMQAFVASFSHKFPGKIVPVLLSLKEGKEFSAVLPLLKPITSKLIISTFDTSQDLPSVSIDPEELAVAAKRFGYDSVTVEPAQDKAYRLLLDEPGDVAIITGSFYLLGQLRSKHLELRNG